MAVEPVAPADTTTVRGNASGRVPADALLHPVAFVALAVLIVNDHWLKSAWPGPVTAKLSDVAGLVLAPLVLQAAVESLLWAAHRSWGPSRRVLAFAVLLVGVGFALAKSTALGAEAYRTGLGLLQWPFAAAAAIIDSTSMPGVVPVDFVADPTDLVALPALVVPLWLGRRRGP